MVMLLTNAQVNVRALTIMGLGLSACAQDGDTQGPDPYDGIGDVTIELSEVVPTAATVRWTTDEPTIGRVHFRTSGEPELVTRDTEEGTEHKVTLVGMLPSRSYEVDIAVGARDDEHTSGGWSVQTGALPSGLPSLTREEFGSSLHDRGYTLLPMISTSLDSSWARILDSRGRTVWALPLLAGTPRMHLTPDGSGIFVQFTWVGEDPDERQYLIQRYAFDGRLMEEKTVEGAHHDFTVVDKYTIATLGFDPRKVIVDGKEHPVLGDSIIEIDASGEARTVWNLLDDRSPAMHELREGYIDGFIDWSHCNYLNYVRDEDAYYITCRHIDAVVKVGRSTGEAEWFLEQDGGDFSHDETRDLLRNPHSVELLGDELLVFNQHASGCSEALIIRVDHDAGTAERTWSHEDEGCAWVGYLGNAWPLPGGNILVAFSEAGLVSEVDPAGEVQVTTSAELGWIMAYTTHVDDLYEGLP
jgi:hypothetical protein